MQSEFIRWTPQPNSERDDLDQGKKASLSFILSVSLSLFHISLSL